MTNGKTGLVLEGGGMRGMFTCGVTDTLMEEQMLGPDQIQGVVGVSAGAAFGCNIASGQPGRALRYNKRFARDPRYMGLLSWLVTGNLMNTKWCYDVVPNRLDPFDGDAFRDSPIRFYLVCTDIATQQPVYHELREMGAEGLRWIQASTSLPIAANPVDIDGHKLLDGGITDSIPLRYFQRQGYGRNLVILTQPSGYRKRHTWRDRLWYVVEAHRPKVAELMNRRPAMYNAQLDYLDEQTRLGNTLVVSPPEPLTISRLSSNPDDLDRVYRVGRQVARDMLPQIREFLEGE